jgi:hypothetical protein
MFFDRFAESERFGLKGLQSKGPPGLSVVFGEARISIRSSSMKFTLPDRGTCGFSRVSPTANKRG